QYFTIFAMACCAGSGLFVLVLAIRRLFFDYTAAEGLFTLFGVLFFLMSVALLGIGLIGEYVGRTYQVVRARSRYHVRAMLETKSWGGGGAWCSSATARSVTSASRCCSSAAITWSRSSRTRTTRTRKSGSRRPPSPRAKKKSRSSRPTP